ncbi:anti-sigma factor [Sphingomonas daechungensis]|uniref:Anti-sigma factor n=1 Tax=Sphingomonas daechungensis TaxID=1176646 RepID=A0ABX6T8I7_9SPHN|nr:anti-sigma factor [Sphingomonas daechungensis]QNP43983.1 anti-sigma factor [Sphingomonas daechungensis]
MSDDRTDMDDRNILAGEYALGALTGDDLRRARDLDASDAEFRADVERWTGRFTRLYEEVSEVAPPRMLWSRITADVGHTGASGNVVALRRKVSIWRGSALGMTGIAAALALFLVFRPPVPVPVRAVPAEPMVAVLGDAQEAKVVANWDPDRRQLITVVSGKLSGDPAHSHELWVIPAGGKPVSLGTLPGSDQSHVTLAEALAKLLQEGATIAISVEPRGGSPTGAPTGPVVASGPLKPA